MHEGAGWIKKAFGVEPSPLGEAVANLLGDAFYGIYHLNPTSLRKVEWADPTYVAVVIDRPLATFDFDELTRLVVLCHDRLIRMQVRAAAPRYLKLEFSQRKERHGDKFSRHPTIEDAIVGVRATVKPDFVLGRK